MSPRVPYRWTSVSLRLRDQVRLPPTVTVSTDVTAEPCPAVFKSTGVCLREARALASPHPSSPWGPRCHLLPRPPTATPRNAAVHLLSTNAILPTWQTPISSGAVPDPSWCQVRLRTLATQVAGSLLGGPDAYEHPGQAPLRTLSPGRDPPRTSCTVTSHPHKRSPRHGPVPRGLAAGSSAPKPDKPD